MKVENGNILIDDEMVDLDNVVMIDVAQVGSHFDKPKFALSIIYSDATSKTVAESVDKSKLKLFGQLNKIGKMIINRGNDNFVNLGFALINMDLVNTVKYNAKDEKIIVLSLGRHINSFRATPTQAKRTLVKVENAYNKYNQSRVQKL